MLTRKDRERFERMTLGHLPAAYNLARWLVRNPSDAEDIVQTAYMRAFEAFHQFSGNSAASWMLTIVRNTAYNWLTKQKQTSNLISFDEALHGSETESSYSQYSNNMNPEEIMKIAASKMKVRESIDRLPTEFREILFLREIEGYSYKEITEITQIPKGTVMSRLSRARKHLHKILTDQQKREHAIGL